MTDTTTIADTTQEVTEATQQAVKQVNQITQYLQDSIPGLITFGLEVLAALVAFFIGRLVIKWIRKIVRRSFERSEADKGVEQFVDSLLKYGLYGILIFCLISSLGFDTTSVAALLASSGVAIGLDRFVMLLAGKDNIREVIAFPKNNKASDPMTQAPSLVADKQLEELALHVELENE